MSDRPKIAPDGEPKRAAKNSESTAKSRITEVQDPLIAGDAGKAGKPLDAGDANVDEAGQIRRKKNEVDLLH